MSYFKSELKRKWTAAYKKQDVFLQNNHKWLQGTLEFPEPSARSTGRPKKPFDMSSDRSKLRKTKELRSSTSCYELLFAAQTQLQVAGKRDAAQVLKNIETTPTRAKKYKKAYARSLLESTSQITPLQALAMFIEAGLSRYQYEVVRQSKKGLYPCYSVLQRAKKQCYPPKESYRVTATCAEICLQDLLHTTGTRLLTYLSEVLETLTDEECINITMISKWGCDGSQQTRYKQKLDDETASDASIFQSSLVPLQILSKEKIIWQNPTPSSPRYCRPIRIIFAKESVDLTNSEITYIQDAISKLKDTEINLDERRYNIKHTLFLTMVDAKICNAATNTTSTMKCYVCGASSKTFNDLSNNQAVNEEVLTFGLSILHARIRFFESLLHLSYKLPVKKWQIRKEADKKVTRERKAHIQKEFREQMGIIVDVPKPGFGNTNDGNTSRRFFAQPKLAAQITGIHEKLIYRLKVILEVISSGYRIHTEKFAEYTMDTAKLYVQLYSWHPMTPTMHKILLHGPIIVQRALLPIGQFSEEAAEARNKHFRMYRQNFARKFSREACNVDILNRLLLSSDPVITGMRSRRRKTSGQFSTEALDMLLEPENVSSEQTSEASSEDVDTQESSDDEPLEIPD